MIRKTLFFNAVLFATISAAHAVPAQYCMSPEKLTDLQRQLPELDEDMQNAYNELFDTMLAAVDNGATADAGCVTPSELAQICTNTLNGATAECEDFVYHVTTEPSKSADAKQLSVSENLHKTNFNDINPTVFAKALDKAAARRNSSNKHISVEQGKLNGMGWTFLSQATEKQINPFIATAISLYESGRGTSNAAQNYNNIAGLGGPGRWIRFDSVEDSIATQAKTLQTNVNAGRKELKVLACSGKYCATNTGSWYANVSSILKEMYRNYNEILGGNK